MKFLPEQKNKQLWSFGLLLVSIIGIVYFNFFSGPASSKNLRSADEVVVPAVTKNPAPANGASGQTASSTPHLVIKKSVGGLLPYGVNIDTSLLEKEAFKMLKAAAALTVKPEELGKDNLFAK